MLKEKIKKILPNSLLLLIRKIRKVQMENKKKLLSDKMIIKHQALINDKKDKKKIKVVFLVLVESVWKVDAVFKKMLDDSYFEPVILVCPYIVYGEERMKEEMQGTYDYFKNKNYPVINAYDAKEDSYIELDKLKPDLLFFTIPHKSTISIYYEEAYQKYLSCFVPYFYLQTFHDGEESLYNYKFHNAMWKIFLPHSISFVRTKIAAVNKGINAKVTGYPACENLYNKKIINQNIWKKQDKEKLKIIWAPHHSIDEHSELYLSTFLLYAEYFKDISIKYEEKIQWAFKPHPSLKSKLYNLKDWGKNKTDEYYKYWIESDNTQLEEGAYDDLFLLSDAMVHDSGSFLVEYLYSKKPVMYLMTSKTEKNLNDFGLGALESCYKGYNKKEIEEFIVGLLDNSLKYDEVFNKNLEFYNSEILFYFKDKYPSDRIIEEIKNGFKN